MSNVCEARRRRSGLCTALVQGDDELISARQSAVLACSPLVRHLGLGQTRPVEQNHMSDPTRRREIYVRPVPSGPTGCLTRTKPDPRATLFRTDFLDFEHSISISFESSSLSSSLHSTSRTVQLKMIYLNVSRLISHRIFFINHFIQFFSRHFYSWFGSIFIYTTTCSKCV